MNDDEVSALDDRIELAVRRAIAQELTSHRDYIGQLSKFTAIAAFTVLAFLATALTFWFGNRLDELQETMLPDATKQMEQSVADINENLLSRANKLVSDTVDELNISAIVAREFDTQTQSDPPGQGERNESAESDQYQPVK